MISLLYLILLIITAVGIILLRGLTKENKPFILLPAGMVWGVTVYIFLLNFISKFLPGQAGILLSTFCFILIGIVTLILTHSKNVKLKFPNFTSFLFLIALVILAIYFSRLKMTSVFPVADSDMQWAYAASFARGNYPIKVPWQPDLNPNYHLGAYFLEGALLFLSGLPLITIHALLNTYFLIAGSLFAIFIIWEYKYCFRNIWLILSALILYVSFGVIILVLPAQNFFKNSNILPETLLTITQLRPDIPAKGKAGASLVDLDSLSYLPARSLSIGLAFLAIYFTFTAFKNTRLKILSFVLLFSVAALVEESMFLPMLLTLIGILILSLFPLIPKLEYLKKERKVLFYITLITGLAVVLQGGFISDLTHQAKSNFNIYLPFSKAFMDKLILLKTYTLPSTSTAFSLLIPNPVLLSLITLTYSLIFQKKILSIISLYSLIAFFCYLSIEYVYCPSCSIRFHSFSYISAGLGISFLIFFLMKNRSNLQNLLVFLIITFIIAPTFMPEILIQARQIKEARLNSNRSHILISTPTATHFEKMSTWASKNLPVNSRILSIDTDQPTPKRSIQLQYKGLYTTLGPQYVHTTRPEPGPEYFDLVLTLNPTLLKQTKTDYIYIESESPTYQNLPQFRKDDLENSNFFEKLQSIDLTDRNGQHVFYRIYKILPQYLDPFAGGKEIKDGTIDTLHRSITPDSSVYISDYGNEDKLISFWYKMAIVLGLKDKNIIRNTSQTDYQVIETIIPHINGKISDKKYNFYILSPNQYPPYPAKQIWSNIFASAWKIN